MWKMFWLNLKIYQDLLYYDYMITQSFGYSGLPFVNEAVIAVGTSFVNNIAIFVLAITSKCASKFYSLVKTLFIV